MYQKQNHEGTADTDQYLIHRKTTSFAFDSGIFITPTENQSWQQLRLPFSKINLNLTYFPLYVKQNNSPFTFFASKGKGIVLPLFLKCHRIDLTNWNILVKIQVDFYFGRMPLIEMILHFSQTIN